MNDAETNAAMGLPPTWRPHPIAYGLVTRQQVGPGGPTTDHVLVVHTVCGSQGFRFSPDELRELGRQIQEQVTGIVVADKVPGNGGTVLGPLRSV